MTATTSTRMLFRAIPCGLRAVIGFAWSWLAGDIVGKSYTDLSSREEQIGSRLFNGTLKTGNVGMVLPLVSLSPSSPPLVPREKKSTFGPRCMLLGQSGLLATEKRYALPAAPWLSTAMHL